MWCWLAVSVLWLLALRPSLGQEQPGPGTGLLDPVGTWRCVIYGNPSLGEERVLLRFAPDQSVRVARDASRAVPAWSPLSSWEITRERLTFTDPRTGRRFGADLARETLAGEWRTFNLLGGWWCSPADRASEPEADILSEPGGLDAGSTKRLIPEVMATPTFPVQAIREAREGRVVLCFIVEPSGEVFDPEFVELSDEIFRAPSLDALMRSRYRPWNPRTDGGARPACRSFIFRLDYVF